MIMIKVMMVTIYKFGVYRYLCLRACVYVCVWVCIRVCVCVCLFSTINTACGSCSRVLIILSCCLSNKAQNAKMTKYQFTEQMLS